MRWILPLLLLIAGVGFLAAELPCSEQYRVEKNRPVAEISSDWRRTAEGWRRASSWTELPAAHAPALHPAIVGSFQLLSVLAVSLALDKGETRGHA